MRKALLLLLLAVAGGALHAQTDDTTPVAAGNEIYTVVELSPEFPGGYEGLIQYLAANIQYPEQAKAEGVEGTVSVTFVIEPDGTTSHRRVLRSPHEALSQEALRVIREMPRWKAGRVRGEKVRVQYTLPINFELN